MNYQALANSYTYSVSYDPYRKLHIAKCEEIPQILINDKFSAKVALAKLKALVPQVLSTLAEMGKTIPPAGEVTHVY